MFTACGLFIAAAVGWAGDGGVWLFVAPASGGSAVVLAVTAVRPAPRLIPDQPEVVREERARKRPLLLAGVAVMLVGGTIGAVSGGVLLALFSLAMALFMLSVTMINRG